MWESKFGGEARVRVVVGISSEVRRGTVGGEGEGESAWEQGLEFR